MNSEEDIDTYRYVRGCVIMNTYISPVQGDFGRFQTDLLESGKKIMLRLHIKIYNIYTTNLKRFRFT